MRGFLVVLAVALLPATPVAAQGPDGPESVRVYLTPGQALREAFPDADTVRTEAHALDLDLISRVERRLGWRGEESEGRVHLGYRAGQLLGYAAIAEQVGLYRPITFLVKVAPDGRVDDVWIMVYRESRGGEVRRKRFLSQYEGKGAKDPIRLNRDVIGITGATLSVRAISAGVKRVVTLIDEIYFKK